MANSSLTLNPIAVLEGQIAIGHRLKKTDLALAKTQGVTHIVTLISESEGALEVQKVTEQQALNWLWLPFENARPPDSVRQDEFRRHFSELQALLEDGAYLYLHCSAGIHRTGMVTYALLRYMNFNAAEAFATLKALRELSSQEVGSDRLYWGDSFAPDHAVPLPKVDKSRCFP